MFNTISSATYIISSMFRLHFMREIMTILLSYKAYIKDFNKKQYMLKYKYKIDINRGDTL